MQVERRPADVGSLGGQHPLPLPAPEPDPAAPHAPHPAYDHDSLLLSLVVPQQKTVLRNIILRVFSDYIWDYKMSSRISKGIKILEESEYFSASRYSNSYPDVAISGLLSAEHYFRIGGLLGRDPGPKFSTQGYLKKYADVAKAEMNALCHYETYGRIEGHEVVISPDSTSDIDLALLVSLIDLRRPAVPEVEALAFLEKIFTRSLKGKPVRLYQNFDAAQTRNFVDCLTSLPAEGMAATAMKATVVMPTYNRADKVELAIRSVLDQSHQNLELIIIDDGSSDGTQQILKKYDSDPRVRVFQNSHSGVSAARNTGLDNATGEVIFYLDSDNLWTRDFVKLMLIGLQISKGDCAYGATRMQGPMGELIGYRGEPFDWDSCIKGNYVDMNVFCHRRHVTTDAGRFDTTLKRMVDWDLILRYTKKRGAIYCPVIGCIYLEDNTDPTRITTSQPYVFRKIVHEKNLKGHASSEEALKAIKFNIALKIPVPYEACAAWGDYHYAESLKIALTALGHKVRIDFHGKWYDHPVNHDDIAIVLRGLTEYIPRPGQLNLMWNISHPDQISYDEYKAYQPPYPPQKREEVAAFVHKYHSFDAGAEAICTWVRNILSANVDDPQIYKIDNSVVQSVAVPEIAEESSLRATVEKNLIMARDTQASYAQQLKDLEYKFEAQGIKLADSRREALDLSQQLAARFRELGKLTWIMVQKDREHGKLRSAARKAEHNYQAMLASTSWRITTPLRHLIMLVRRLSR